MLTPEGRTVVLTVAVVICVVGAVVAGHVDFEHAWELETFFGASCIFAIFWAMTSPDVEVESEED